MSVQHVDVGAWNSAANHLGLTPVVKVNDMIFVSGTTGRSKSTDAEEQLVAAFQDIADTLAAVGCGWNQVVKMTTYHTGSMQEHMDLLLSVKDRYVRPPYPAWTGVGVTELANPWALIEIEVVAVAAHQSTQPED